MGLDPHTAVEVEAVPPDALRDRVRTAIYDCIDDGDAWDAMLRVEQAERVTFLRMADHFGGAA